MALRRVVPVVLFCAALLAPASAHAGDVGSQVFSMINAGRGTPLVLHHGLLDEAWQHSQYMSQTGSLNHDNADERAMSAAPDPAEGNGAPDDGFPQAGWCENATYVVPAQGDPATAIYNNWKNSPPHAACMNNTGKNVGAVGVYWDGSTYWATFVAEVDSTPPGGGSSTSSGRNNGPTTQDVTNPSKPTQIAPNGIQVPKATPAPAAPAPVYHSSYVPTYNTTATAKPSPKPKPKARPAVHNTDPNLMVPVEADIPATKTRGFGMPDYAAIVAVLVLGCLFLERRLYVPAEFVKPEPTEKKELATTTAR